MIRIHYLYYGTVFFLLGLFSSLQEVFLDYKSCCIYFWSLAVCLWLAAIKISTAKVTAIFIAGSFLFTGIGCGLNTGQSAEMQLRKFIGQQVVVRGSVEFTSLSYNESYVSMIIKVREISGTAENIPYNGRLRLLLKDSEKFTAGEVIVVGKLDKLPNFRNPGGFNAKIYNRINFLGGRLLEAKLLSKKKEINFRQRLELLQADLCNRITALTGKTEGAILSGMVFGGSSRLSEETRTLFAINGIAHLLSVSGTHIIMFTGLLMALLQPLPKTWRKLIIVILLMLYAGLCGLRPPVLRALLMSSVLLLGGRGAERGRLFCLTAVFLLIYQPLWLLDIGFQLSFGAAAGLLWLFPACKRWLPQFIPDIIKEAMAVTLAAQLAVMPLEIYYFHQVSIISLLSNVLLVPVLETAAQLALAGCLLPCGEYFLQAAVWLLKQVLIQAEYLAALPYSTLVIGEMPAYCIIFYYAVIALAADFSCLQYLCNRERYILISSFICIISVIFMYQQLRTLPLRVYFMDVGQGDCTVVITPKQKVVVIDTGGLKNFSTGSRIIVPFLRSLGYNTIDILLLSHYDYDHIGGVPDLLKQMQVKRIILPKEFLSEDNKSLYRQILLLSNKSQVSEAAIGQIFSLDNRIKFKIIDVPHDMTMGNEASTLAAIESPYGNLLFTGDLGAEREADLQLVEKYTVLKVAHHGSRYSSTDEFLQQVKPKLAVISCGYANRYGHPHEETISRLKWSGCRILRTDEYGCINIVLNKDDLLHCYSYKNYRWQRL